MGKSRAVPARTAASRRLPPNVSALALELNQDTGKMRQEIVIEAGG